MGLLDMLSGKINGNQAPANQQQQPAAPQPGQPGANGAPSSTAPVAQPNTMGVPHTGAAPANDNQTPANPLDAFKGLFDTTNTKPNEPPRFTLPQEALDKVVQAQDFTQGIPQELMQKVQAGDPNAIVQAINVASQQAYRAALQHNSTLSDEYIQQRLLHERGTLGTDVRTELTNAELFSADTQQPDAVKSGLKAVAVQLQTMHPDATPKQIAAMTRDYFAKMAAVVNPQQPGQQGNNQTAQGQVDWDKELFG